MIIDKQTWNTYNFIWIAVLITVSTATYFLGLNNSKSASTMNPVQSNQEQNLGKYLFIQKILLSNGLSAHLIQEESRLDGEPIDDCSQYKDSCVESHSRLELIDDDKLVAESVHFKDLVSSSSEIIPLKFGSKELYFVNWLSLGVHSSSAVILERVGTRLDLVCRDFDETVEKNENGTYPRDPCSYWSDEGTPYLEDKNKDGSMEIYEDSRNYNTNMSEGNLVTEYIDGRFISNKSKK